MSTVDDLTTWLRAQLDDDERVARAAGGCQWDLPAKAGYPTGHDAELEAEEQHTARHDPARVLAEVDAKRRILDLYDVSTDRNLDPDGWELMKHAVRALALPYADREGYRDEWRP